MKLEKENNFLRIKNVQNKRDELELEKHKAEIERLRNLVSEYKDQAEFYGKTTKEREKLVAEKTLKKIALDLKTAGSNTSNLDSDYNRISKTLNDSLKNKPSNNFSRTSKNPKNDDISHLLAGYLKNYNDKDLKVLDITGKGELYEDQNLKIKVDGKAVKLKSDSKIYYKMIMEFINKDDFLSIKNFSPTFTGNKGK